MKKTTENVALILLRGQGIHYGHTSLFYKAMMECDTVLILFGSSNQPISDKNPFTIAQRMNMAKLIFGNDQKKIKYMSIADINAVTKEEWCDHLFDVIEKNNAPQPTHYYAGDSANANWFRNIENKYTGKELKINIVDRLQTSIMSGTDVRQYIMEDLDDWKNHVPPVIHSYIEENFPIFLKQEYKEKMNKFVKEIDEIDKNFLLNEFNPLSHNFKETKIFIDYIKDMTYKYSKLKNNKVKEDFETIKEDFEKVNSIYINNNQFKIKFDVFIYKFNEFLKEYLKSEINEIRFH